MWPVAVAGCVFALLDVFDMCFLLLASLGSPTNADAVRCNAFSHILHSGTVFSYMRPKAAVGLPVFTFFSDNQ